MSTDFELTLVLCRAVFGAPWWAFTFPLDALAYAAARYALDHPSTLWRMVCAATLALATLAVSLVLVRSLTALVRAWRTAPLLAPVRATP